MTYEKLVEILANAKLEKIPVAMSEEMLEVYSSIEDKEKFMTDVATKYEELKHERENYKKNNTPEYQQSIKKYKELREKYVEILKRDGYLLGISVEDMNELLELGKYGVNSDLKHFLNDVQRHTQPIQYSPEQIKKSQAEFEKNFEKLMDFDEKFKYGIPEEENKMKM